MVDVASTALTSETVASSITEFVVNSGTNTKRATSALVKEALPVIGCSAYNNGTQSITTATVTVVTLGAELFDSGTMHSTSSNTSRLVAPATGKYQITYCINWDSNSSGIRIGFVRKNAAGAGTDSDNMIGSGIRVPASSTAGAVVSLAKTFMATLTAGDYVELFVYQDSGGTRTIGAATGGTTNGDATQFSLIYLGA